MAWLRLLRSRRVGISTFFRLMAQHDSACEALEALPEMAREAGERDYAPCPLPVVEQEIDWAERFGARMLCFGEPAYPRRLMDIPDPPPVLWALGDTGLLDRSTVAVVGARNASSLGTRMARRLARELGQGGQVVVSGLARGIDTAAHDAALETGTIAVMAGGVDVIYPAENTVLGEEIARRGLRLSEAPMGLSPQARHFPRRNRIISGLSRAVVVVEAAVKSGSLMTADMALEQGREVFAVPGHPFDARASGCNRLIRDGATLARGPQDVLSVLEDLADVLPAATSPGPAPCAAPPAAISDPPPAIAALAPSPDAPATPRAPRSHAETIALHQQILARLEHAAIGEDELARDLGARADDVACELSALELDGQVLRGPGGVLMRRH